MLDLRRARNSWAPTATAAAACGAAATLLVVFGGTAGGALGLAAVGLVWIAATDASTHRVPNPLVLVVAAVLLGGATLSGPETVRAAVSLGAAWFATLLGVHLLDSRLGFGDVKLAAALGMMIGLATSASGRGVALALLLSSVVFVAGAAATAAVGARSRKPIPFAPALVTAVIAAAVAIGVAT